MGKSEKPPPIIDAEFEVVTPPNVQWQSARYRFPRWVVWGRILAVVIVVAVVLDIVSNGNSAALLRNLLSGR